MLSVKQYKEDLAKVVQRLPAQDVVELLDFAQFLRDRSSKAAPTSATDEGSLSLQQQSLSKIWDNPAEDIYEL